MQMIDKATLGVSAKYVVDMAMTLVACMLCLCCHNDWEGLHYRLALL